MKIVMNMKQFNYVTILAQEKRFSRTAEKLNISQPSLSQYIRKIEKELGKDDGTLKKSMSKDKFNKLGFKNQISIEKGLKMMIEAYNTKGRQSVTI